MRRREERKHIISPLQLKALMTEYVSTKIKKLIQDYGKNIKKEDPLNLKNRIRLLERGYLNKIEAQALVQMIEGSSDLLNSVRSVEIEKKISMRFVCSAIFLVKLIAMIEELIVFSGSTWSEFMRQSHNWMGNTALDENGLSPSYIDMDKK